MKDDNEQPVGRAKGGKARAAAMTPEERKLSAQKAADAKKELAILPVAEYGSSDTPLKLGDVEIQCYVLSTGERVLSQRGMASGLGMSTTATERLLNFVGGDRIKPFLNNDVLPLIETPIKFKHPGGGGVAFGYPATILADICDAVLEARKAGTLQKQQAHIAERAEILVRGFARVGIVALVDEATGYQKARERDALAKYLEEFIANEMRPWVKTYPVEFFEELCRLRGVEFKSNLQTPRYFGRLINNITYERMLPSLREALKAEKKKANKTGAKMHQFLSGDSGAALLHKRLISTIDFMRASRNYEEFIGLLDRVYPVIEVKDFIAESE
ncbi:P63C domain-containing protein [Klebsiella aerogenes]|uniref:P63C domain-containing protein n=1 Tax=Klebsiella aerogenes TaxID=548 RepID=UPI0034D379D7